MNRKLLGALLAGALLAGPALAADPNGGLAVTTGSGTTLCAFTGTGTFTQVYTCTIPVFQNGSGVGVPVSTSNGLPVAQATAANLNMTEANSASILAALQASTPAGTNNIGSVNAIPQNAQAYSNAANWVQGFASTTGSGATTILAAAGAGLKNYAPVVVCWNSSAVSITVTLNDTLTTGTATVIFVPAGGYGIGGGGVVPIATAANTALTFTPSGAETTIGCGAQGYKAT